MQLVPVYRLTLAWRFETRLDLDAPAVGTPGDGPTLRASGETSGWSATEYFSSRCRRGDLLPNPGWETLRLHPPPGAGPASPERLLVYPWRNGIILGRVRERGEKGEGYFSGNADCGGEAWQRTAKFIHVLPVG